MLGKKGQISIVVMVAAVVFLIASLGIFFISLGPVSLERVSQETRIHSVSHYIDVLNDFSNTVGIFSSYLTIRENAGLGGINPHGSWRPEMGRYWYCNGPTIPSLEYVLYFLEEGTELKMNQYLNKNLNKQRGVLQINSTNYSCCHYDVSESDVFSGFLDDAGFTVQCDGSEVEVRISGLKMDALNSQKYEILENRYFKLYRGFVEWASSSSLAEKVCSCIPLSCSCPTGSCSECAPLKSCIKSAFEQERVVLESIMNDEYIDCYSSVSCCYHEQGIPVCDPRSCVSWLSPECFGCYRPSEGSRCHSSLSSEIENTSFSVSFQDAVEEEVEGVCINYKSQRAAVEGQFSCTDKKYNNPSETGLLPVSYSVMVSVSLEHLRACQNIADCIDTPEGPACPEPGPWCESNCHYE